VVYIFSKVNQNEKDLIGIIGKSGRELDNFRHTVDCAIGLLRDPNQINQFYKELVKHMENHSVPATKGKESNILNDQIAHYFVRAIKIWGDTLPEIVPYLKKEISLYLK